MTASTLERPVLLDRLLALADCPNAENYLCITARRAHGARSVAIERPTLAIVLRGRKQLRSPRTELDLGPGQLFVAMRGCRLDVVNSPDAASGLYLTLTIPLC